MAEFKRDRRIYRVFHSTDSDAHEILVGIYKETYPDATDEDIQNVSETAAEAVQTALANNSWFALSPEGRLTLISPLEAALAYEDVETDVWADVQAERREQVLTHGYDANHDDEHGGDHLIEVAKSYLSHFGETPTALHVRHELIKSIATLVAAVEFIDRAQESALVGKLDAEDVASAAEQIANEGD